MIIFVIKMEIFLKFIYNYWVSQEKRLYAKSLQIATIRTINVGQEEHIELLNARW